MQNNIEKIYEIVTKRNEKMNSFYSDLGEIREDIERLVTRVGLEINDETLLAMTKRFVSLREDSILALLKEKFDEDELIERQMVIYEVVKSFWLENHRNLIEELKPHLTPFYYELLKGVQLIGEVFSDWQVEWINSIVNGINRELFRLFDGDEERIFQTLKEKELFDKAPTGEVGDRCYSVLVYQNDKFQVKCYSEVFHNEVREAVKEIDKLILTLQQLEDEYKKEWLEYLYKIKIALLGDDNHSLIEKWADVDRAWMDIKSPIQMGHPLEYYEDHYRKAVALELDIRITNPKRKSFVRENIKKMYNKNFKGSQGLLSFSLKKIDETQLYLGQPALFYGAEFNGLFSAQVVPNDEVVSQEKGKKIFAFADKILADSKARPKMLISYEVFGKEFMEESHKLLQNEELWYKIYDITTVGHEFGHILWTDTNSEAVMNESGAYKNVEEFKATMGGIMAFFEKEEEELKEYILIDTIKRSVGLISWMEVGDVLPYYIEGLIHLKALFESKVLRFDGKLHLDLERYEEWKKEASKNYLNLAHNYYIPKKDPKEFLQNFVTKEGKIYLPKDEKIREFVEWYYGLYKEIGQKIYEG
jgi:hypothetical protein